MARVAVDELGRDAQAEGYPLWAAIGGAVTGGAAYVIDSRTISSPPLIRALLLAQRGQVASRSVVSPLCPQSGQSMVAGTVTSSTAASAASVPSAIMLNAWAKDSSSTACRTPNRTRTPVTRRPPARWRTASTTPSHKPNSCMPLPDVQTLVITPRGGPAAR